MKNPIYYRCLLLVVYLHFSNIFPDFSRSFADNNSRDILCGLKFRGREFFLTFRAGLFGRNSRNLRNLTHQKNNPHKVYYTNGALLERFSYKFIVLQTEYQLWFDNK